MGSPGKPKHALKLGQLYAWVRMKFQFLLKVCLGCGPDSGAWKMTSLVVIIMIHAGFDLNLVFICAVH